MDNMKRRRYIKEQQMTRNIEPELMINQILMLIQITGKRRLGIAIEKQMW
jgi:hypothetical protein